MESKPVDPEFAEMVRCGLNGSPRSLSSRYFYDVAGDRLFREIMASDGYYLTDCEREILRGQGQAIAERIGSGGPFELVELGAGDGSKICHLIDALHDRSAEFLYKPLDISEHVLGLLADRLRPTRPWLRMEPIAGNYMHWLAQPRSSEQRRVFAFMGSNLGNFEGEGAVLFLSRIRAAMNPGDLLLVGLDLKKDPALIRAAYDDVGGITARFNLNLLKRINRELGGDFDLERWRHSPSYDPESGAARSALKSTVDQTVRIEALGESFNFSAGELVHTEISQKYDDALIATLAEASGFRVTDTFVDPQGWFSVLVWAPV